LRQEAVACLRHRRFVPGALYRAIPAIRVVRKGEGSDDAIRAASFDRAQSDAPLDRRLFSTEDADNPRPFSDLVLPSPDRVDL